MYLVTQIHLRLFPNTGASIDIGWERGLRTATHRGPDDIIGLILIGCGKFGHK